MKVHIPTPLRSYTTQHSEVEVEGTSLAEILAALDQRYPGFRFRIITEQDTIRPHIRIFINDEHAMHLTAPLRPDDRLYIVCALSGG